MKGYKAAELDSEEHSKSERSLRAQCQALADMKFTYVVSCQQYGIDKRSGDPRAKDILKLMTKYVSHINSCHVIASLRNSQLYVSLSLSQVPISSGSFY